MNTSWDFTHELSPRSGFCSAFCCIGGGSSTGQVYLSTRLTKPLYFTDEEILCLIEIDNSESDRLILSIEVTLRQTVSYKTADLDDPEKGKEV